MGAGGGDAAGRAASGVGRGLRRLLVRAGGAALLRLGLRAERVAPGAVLVRRPAATARQRLAQEDELLARLSLDQLVALARLYRVNCVVDASGRPEGQAQRLRRAGFGGKVVAFDPERERPDELVLPPAPRILLRLGARPDGPGALAALGDRVGDVVVLQAELALLHVDDGTPALRDVLADLEAAGFEVAGLYPLSRQARTARILELESAFVRAAAVSRPRFPTRGSPPRSPSASAR
ncbi:MAG: hypothetical protein M3P39_09970 [Actinomycetota bacterium]|nr:hypothetical protein [Actinomycetota bacterium]